MAMRTTNVRLLFSTMVLAAGLAGTIAPRPVAAKDVAYEACVVDRRPTAALMTLGEQVLFELDLRQVASTPFALRPGDCVTVFGLDRDNEPGLRREFPQASWLVEAQVIAATKSHLNPSSSSNNQDDDDDEDDD
jgi:hypothetical protein